MSAVVWGSVKRRAFVSPGMCTYTLSVLLLTLSLDTSYVAPDTAAFAVEVISVSLCTSLVGSCADFDTKLYATAVASLYSFFDMSGVDVGCIDLN